MLRRSTGLSEEMNRVGVSKENVWRSGLVKWRCVATPRLSVALSKLAASGDVVGVGGVFEAMERRRLVRGSWETLAIVRSGTSTAKRQVKTPQRWYSSFEGAEFCPRCESQTKPI